MLGLGNSLIKGGVVGTSIVTDNLVLKHMYNAGAVVPVSDGAVDVNADTAANEYIDVGTIEITTNDVSMSAWVYVTAHVDNAAIIVNRHVSGDNQGLGLRVDSGNQRFEVVIDEATSGARDDGDDTYNLNQWYHVCGVWDRDDKQYLYVNGVLNDSGAITDYQDSLTHTTNVFIGKNQGSAEFRGYICNVGYWNAALTPAQVKSIMWKNYAGLTTSETTNLVSWWNLDSTIDSTATLGHTVVYDNHYGGGDVLGDNLIPNPECDSLSTWTLQNIGASDSVEVSTEQSYSGGSSIKIVGTASNDGIVNASINEAVVVGGLYRFEMWVYVLAGVAELNPGDGPFGSYSPSTDEEAVSTTTNQWEKLVTYAWADATGTQLVFISQSTGVATTFYVDNVKVQRVNGNPGELI